MTRSTIHYKHTTLCVCMYVYPARLRALGIDRQMLVDLGFENDETRAVSRSFPLICLPACLPWGTDCHRRDGVRRRIDCAGPNHSVTNPR